MSSSLEPLVQYGAVGVLLVLALIALRSLHQELAAERAARIQDAKDGTKLLLEVQKEVLAAVEKLTDLYAMLQEERREEKNRKAS